MDKDINVLYNMTMVNNIFASLGNLGFDQGVLSNNIITYKVLVSKYLATALNNREIDYEIDSNNKVIIINDVELGDSYLLSFNDQSLLIKKNNVVALKISANGFAVSAESYINDEYNNCEEKIDIIMNKDDLTIKYGLLTCDNGDVSLSYAGSAKMIGIRKNNNEYYELESSDIVSRNKNKCIDAIYISPDMEGSEYGYLEGLLSAFNKDVQKYINKNTKGAK